MNTLYLISTGIGGINGLTIEAKKALDNSEVIVGYTKYIKELMPLIKNKNIYKSGMTKEIERCQMAINFAKSGKTTSIISNGDINIFGISGDLGSGSMIKIADITNTTCLFVKDSGGESILA